MAPPRRANCQICNNAESKYACPKCEVLYCSVPCYKRHKSSTSCSASASASACNTGTTGTNDATTPTSINVDEELSLVGDGVSVESESRSLSRAAAPPYAHDNDISGNAPEINVTVSGAAPSPLPLRGNGGDDVSGPDSVPASGFGSASRVRRGGVLESKSESWAGLEDVSTGVSAKKSHLTAAGEAEGETEIDTGTELDVEMEVESKAVAGAGHIEIRAQSQSQSNVGNENEDDSKQESCKREDEQDRTSTVDLEEASLHPPSRPLRKLSSLKWPYVPDAPSYPDPLTRDDPKPLSLAQYEAIARSPAIRSTLSKHPRLPSILRSIDSLRGPARERALERMLGIAPSQSSFSLTGLPASSSSLHSHSHVHPTSAGSRRERGTSEEMDLERRLGVDDEDMNALRGLAGAVEGAVRTVGGNEARFGADPLGLDWESMEV